MRGTFPTKILLATDGSQDAKLAARAAADLSNIAKAGLHVAHAWQSVPNPVIDADYFEEAARGVLEEQTRLLSEAGVAVREAHLVMGPPVEAILNLCEEIGADLATLAFLNPAMARARRLGGVPALRGLPAGARRRGRSELSGRDRASPWARPSRRQSLPRVGERFFPVALSHPTPSPVARELTSVKELPRGSVGRLLPENTALRGTVGRAGQFLLLALDCHDDGWAR